jgi:muconolactone D-isomerase
MLFYLQMRWDVEGRLDNEHLWKLVAKEGEAAAIHIKSGALKGIYKVAGQRRVIAIVEQPDAETLDRTIMAGLPMAEFSEFEAIWPLREYEPLIEDCRKGFKI